MFSDQNPQLGSTYQHLVVVVLELVGDHEREGNEEEQEATQRYCSHGRETLKCFRETTRKMPFPVPPEVEEFQSDGFIVAHVPHDDLLLVMQRVLEFALLLNSCPVEHCESDGGPYAAFEKHNEDADENVEEVGTRRAHGNSATSHRILVVVEPTSLVYQVVVNRHWRSGNDNNKEQRVWEFPPILDGVSPPLGPLKYSGWPKGKSNKPVLPKGHVMTHELPLEREMIS